MQLELERIYDALDTSFSGDAVRVKLYVNGIVILEGDWYHDKIESKITGFLAALAFLGYHEVPIVRERVAVPEDGF